MESLLLCLNSDWLFWSIMFYQAIYTSRFLVNGSKLGSIIRRGLKWPGSIQSYPDTRAVSIWRKPQFLTPAIQYRTKCRKPCRLWQVLHNIELNLILCIRLDAALRCTIVQPCLRYQVCFSSWRSRDLDGFGVSSGSLEHMCWKQPSSSLPR